MKPAAPAPTVHPLVQAVALCALLHCLTPAWVASTGIFRYLAYVCLVVAAICACVRQECRPAPAPHKD